MKALSLFLLGGSASLTRAAKTPPMGWMSWQTFRCGLDCSGEFANNCIGERLYKTTADAIVEAGYRNAGYTGVHIDDCWEAWSRDAHGRLAANSSRFPSGIGGKKGLAAYVHVHNLTLGIYSDEGTATCGGYPGSKGTGDAD